jgi:putative colanic acid biosynthesis UDP-glucose lipid carrier transferase
MLLEQIQSVESSGRFQRRLGKFRTAKRVRVSRSVSKRSVDFTLALLAIAFLLPLFVLIAVLIKLDSAGPVFFRQRRSGLNGQTFNILKFRSMTVQENGDRIVQAQADDKRVTRIGRFLRRSSLDEIPQLINILKGDMSFVGPRPHAMAHDVTFAEMVPQYNHRFLARPGLTGLAQVRGFRGEVRRFADIENRVRADVEYIRTWNAFSDLVIIAKTVPLVFGDKNAY